MTDSIGDQLEGLLSNLTKLYAGQDCGVRIQSKVVGEHIELTVSLPEKTEINTGHLERIKKAMRIDSLPTQSEITVKESSLTVSLRNKQVTVNAMHVAFEAALAERVAEQYAEADRNALAILTPFLAGDEAEAKLAAIKSRMLRPPVDPNTADAAQKRLAAQALVSHVDGWAR